MSGENDSVPSVVEAELAWRRRAALERDRKLRESSPERSSDAPSPAGPVRGARITLDREGARYRLAGRALEVGEVIEVYTNTANGWVRGRFEWSGDPSQRPRIAMNLWDPNGQRDEDGLPPWVGDLEATLPERAVCRRPV